MKRNLWMKNRKKNRHFFVTVKLSNIINKLMKNSKKRTVEKFFKYDKELFVEDVVDNALAA